MAYLHKTINSPAFGQGCHFCAWRKLTDIMKKIQRYIIQNSLMPLNHITFPKTILISLEALKFHGQAHVQAMTFTRKETGYSHKPLNTYLFYLYD